MLSNEPGPSRLTSSKESSGVTTGVFFGDTGMGELKPANGAVGSGQSVANCSTWFC